MADLLVRVIETLVEVIKSKNCEIHELEKRVSSLESENHDLQQYVPRDVL